MINIRAGKIRDCKDLLTVYQTTRRVYQTIPGSYTTVEDIIREHRTVDFKNWGWLVAEMDGNIVGEIVFRIEKNPTTVKVQLKAINKETKKNDNDKPIDSQGLNLYMVKIQVIHAKTPEIAIIDIYLL